MSSKARFAIFALVSLTVLSFAPGARPAPLDLLSAPDVLLLIRDQDDAAREALDDLTRELLFSTDLEEDVDRFRRESRLEEARLSHLLVARGTGEGDRDWTVIWAPSWQGGSSSPARDVEGHRIAELSGGLVWGTPDAVSRFSSDPDLRHRWMSAVRGESDAPASEIRARFSPRWVLGPRENVPSWSYRSLMAGVVGAGFEAVAGESVSFRLWVDFDEEDRLWFAERELQSAARSRPPNSPIQAEVQVAGTRAALLVSLPDRGLANLNRSVTVRRLIQWQTTTLNRERWQRVEAIFGAMGLREGSHAADIGAGSGFLSIPMARAVGSTGRVYAVDINSQPLERLKEVAGRASLSDRVEVVLGEADDPHLPDNGLDAIVIVNAYHEMEQYGVMLARFNKALKPDGRLVLVEPWNESRREEERSSQTSNHIIAPELVVAELEAGGFDVYRREDDFITTPTAHWLLVARPRR